MPDDLEGMTDWEIEDLYRAVEGRSPRDGSQPFNRCGEGQPQPSTADEVLAELRRAVEAVRLAQKDRPDRA